MIIDSLMDRYSFSEPDALLPFFLYAAAAILALLLRRWGQIRGARKASGAPGSLSGILLQDLPSSLWYVFFFLLTGCLKGSLREENRSKDSAVNRKSFVTGIRYLLYGWLPSMAAVLLLQGAEGVFPGLLYLIAKALSAAFGSLLFFSLLPLPCSDMEALCIQPDLGEKGIALRKNGTVPFFIFTALSLFLAVIVVAVKGQIYSLIGIITLFPLILIGG